LKQYSGANGSYGKGFKVFSSVHGKASPPAPLQRRGGLWQRAALAGLSKKFNVGKKMKGSMLLLYDFLHKDHLPNTQAFVYRITYSFK
jgi:hypothetical protein